MHFVKARRLFISIVVVCTSILLVGTDPAYAGGAVSTNYNGVAIKGYDPVAYFTMGKPVKGTEEFAHEWLDVTWHFASAEHRDTFAADPITYAPQHGGFCSLGVANKGAYDSGDPTAWRIVDGRLYLFWDSAAAARWDPESPAVARTDEDWQKTLAELIQQ